MDYQSYDATIGAYRVMEMWMLSVHGAWANALKEKESYFGVPEVNVSTVEFFKVHQSGVIFFGKDRSGRYVEDFIDEKFFRNFKESIEERIRELDEQMAKRESSLEAKERKRQKEISTLVSTYGVKAIEEFIEKLQL